MAKWDDGEVIERGRRMKRVLVASSALAVVAILAITAAITATAVGGTAGWRLVGWNNLGMHCMDSEFNIFSILPPYNTIEAQLVDTSGNLVKSGNGVTVTYEAVADPTGSINTTSVGKTDFWQNVFALFGASPAPDAGLAGSNMPGTSNVPQPMTFDAAQNLFQATGIPITPYDDAHAKNYYPLMRLTAKNASGTVLATTDIVLPVSDEMDCKACHASNSSPAAMPFAGWVNDPDPERDYRLNVLTPPRRPQHGQSHLHERARRQGLQRSRSVSHGGPEWQVHPLRRLSRLRGPRRRKLSGRASPDPGRALAPRQCRRSHEWNDPERQRQPDRMLSLPPRLPTRAASAASWATRWRRTAPWPCSARTVTAP